MKKYSVILYFIFSLVLSTVHAQRLEFGLGPNFSKYQSLIDEETSNKIITNETDTKLGISFYAGFSLLPKDRLFTRIIVDHISSNVRNAWVVGEGSSGFELSTNRTFLGLELNLLNNSFMNDKMRIMFGAEYALLLQGNYEGSIFNIFENSPNPIILPLINDREYINKQRASGNISLYFEDYLLSDIKSVFSYSLKFGITDAFPFLHGKTGTVIHVFAAGLTFPRKKH